MGEVRGVSISGAMDSGGGTDYASSPIAGGKRVKGKQDLRKRRGGVDGSGGAKTAGDGSDRGNNVWGITGDITDQTDTKKGSKTVPYDREYEEIKRPATSETFQIRGVGHHIGFVTPRILDGDLGSEGRLFSLQSERSSAEMGGVSMGRQGFQVPSSTVRLFPESVVFHKDHEGSAELLESARVTGGGLSGRFHPNSSLQGDRNLAAGPCDPAYLRSIGIGERNVKGLLGTIDQSPDIGPHFGFIKSDSGDPRRQAYVDPGTGKEIERARASGGSGGGKIGWKGDISGEGFPAGQSGNKIPLCVGGCGSQSTVGVGLQDSSIRASKAGCNLVSGKSAFIQRKAGVETIQSDCHADRCFPLRLGSSDWSEAGGRSVGLSREPPAHQFTRTARNKVGDIVFSRRLERLQSDHKNRFDDSQGVSGKRRLLGSAQKPDNKGYLEPRNQPGFSFLGGLDCGKDESGGRHPQQAGFDRRLESQEDSVQADTRVRRLGSVHDRSICRSSEYSANAFQQSILLPGFGGPGCVFSRVGGGEQLVASSSGSDLEGASTTTGVESKGGHPRARVERSAMVAAINPVSQGLVSDFGTRLRSGTIRPCGGLEEPSMEILGGVAGSLIHLARAPGTHKAYSRWFQRFELFCASRSCAALPASASLVQAFIVSLISEGKAQVKPYLAAIRAKHLDAGFEDPTDAHQIRMIAEGGMRLAAKEKPWPKEREPLPLSALRNFVARHQGNQGFEHIRDAALVALGLRAMLRPGELVALRQDDVRFTNSSLMLRLRTSKADQRGERKPLTIVAVNSPCCPVFLLHNYLRIRAKFPDSLPLFISKIGSPLSVSAVSSVVARMAQEDGLSGSFSGHSLRIGGASAAVEGGLSLEQIRAIGGWKSDAVNAYLLSRSKSVSLKMGF